MTTDRSTSPKTKTDLRRILFLGPTGSGKSKLINCCFNRSIEGDKLTSPCKISEPDRIIGTTSSISNYVDQRNKLIYVDTVGYGDIRFKEDSQSFLLFFRELICYSSIGFNWVFLVLRFGQISQDIFTYIQSLREMLGEEALSRCTIVFTHCSNPPSFNNFLGANQNHLEIIDILRKVHNVASGDMDTSETAPSLSDPMTKNAVKNMQKRKCENFMNHMLRQIDCIDNEKLALDNDWYQYYSRKVTCFFGYVLERIFGKPNEMSKLYKLMDGIRRGIPMAIYYEECSICLELIVEVVKETPKACITSCGHIFHYDCLKRHFQEMKNCPNCRKDLRNLPERVAGYAVGWNQVQEPLKANVY